MNEDQMDEKQTTPLEFLQAVYRNEAVPLAVRMKAAVEALPFVHPKLAVTAVVQGEDFAALLDERLKRIEHAKVINGPSQADDDAAQALRSDGPPLPGEEIKIQ
jgi:hypothetical protein